MSCVVVFAHYNLVLSCYVSWADVYKKKQHLLKKTVPPPPPKFPNPSTSDVDAVSVPFSAQAPFASGAIGVMHVCVVRGGGGWAK